jgi:hypothetical protein
VNCPEVIYRSCIDATPGAELSALAAVYKFVLFDSQARGGDPQDLTNSSTAEMAKHGPRKTEQENT